MAEPLDLRSLLQRENSRLDRCRLVQRGSALYLRATLPSREDPSVKRQTSIALRLEARLDNVREAVEYARRLDDQLLSRRFRWDAWTPEALARPDGAMPSYQDLAAGVEKLYAFKHPDLPRTSSTAWGKKYRPAIKVLQSRTGECSEEALCRLIREVQAPSSRQSTASILRQTVIHLGLPYDRERITEAGKGYTRKTISPRDVPSDEVIESYIDKIELPHWRWMYGMLWLFGIRPHEIVDAELIQRSGKYVLLVPDDTKTGAREAWAYPNSKIEQYGLQEPCRPRQGKHGVAKAAYDYLCASSRNGHGGWRKPVLPFSLYNLRHAYAIRLLINGWPAETGAKLMGHSVKEHNETYQRWVSSQHMAAMHQRFLEKLD